GRTGSAAPTPPSRPRDCLHEPGDHSSLEQPPERLPDRLEQELGPRLVDGGSAATAQPLGETPERAIDVVTNLPPVEEDPALIGMKVDEQATVPKRGRRPEVLESRSPVAGDPEHAPLAAEIEPLGQ